MDDDGQEYEEVTELQPAVGTPLGGVNLMRTTSHASPVMRPLKTPPHSSPQTRRSSLPDIALPESMRLELSSAGADALFRSHLGFDADSFEDEVRATMPVGDISVLQVVSTIGSSLIGTPDLRMSPGKTPRQDPLTPRVLARVQSEGAITPGSTRHFAPVGALYSASPQGGVFRQVRTPPHPGNTYQAVGMAHLTGRVWCVYL